MGGARPHAEREDGLQAYIRICSAARKTAAPIRLQYSNGHLVKHVTRYVTHAVRYVTPLMLMLFMTSNSDYIMLYGTNPGLGLQPVLSLRVRTGAAHLGVLLVHRQVASHGSAGVSGGRMRSCQPSRAVELPLPAGEEPESRGRRRRGGRPTSRPCCKFPTHLRGPVIHYFSFSLCVCIRSDIRTRDSSRMR